MKWGTWLRAEWDRITGFGLIVLGALFVLLGYLGVRNTPFVAEQMAYIASGGIGGLFCLGFGVGLLLSADLHDEWRKLDRIQEELRGDIAPEPGADLVVDADQLSKGSEHDTDSATTPAPGNGRHRPEPVPQRAGTAGAFAVAPASHPAGPAGAFGAGPSHPAGPAGAFGVAPSRQAGPAAALAGALTHPVGGTRRALAFLSLALLLPLLLAGAGWRRASQTADMDVAGRGLGWAVGAVVIAFVFIAVWGLWMRVNVLRRRAAVTRAVRRWNWERFAVKGPAAMAEPSAGTASDGLVFVASGHPRFHEAGCPTLEWIDAVAVSRDAVDAGLAACGLCQP